MHIKAKILFFTKSSKARVSLGNSSLFLILISQHFEFGTAEIASHILRASSDKVNILVAPCRLLASHTYARTRESVGDTPRSTSSKNVLKANTCILRRLGYPPPSRTPSPPSPFFPSRDTHVYVFGHSREDTCAKPPFLYVLFPPLDTSASYLRCTRVYVRSLRSRLWRESISKLLAMMLISLKCCNNKL